MNAAIVAVGSEMLTPARLDTNSLFLTEQLNALGVEVVEKRIIGDDRARLTDAVRSAVTGAEIVLVTGGLGPTEDDVTRDAVAAALDVAQALDESVLAQIADRFARMGRTMADNNRRQAFVLEGAEVLDNPNGTAPGQWFARNGRVVVLLPGPPRELKPMFTDFCVPKLRVMLPKLHIATRWYRVAGMGESDLDALIAPAYTKYANPVTTVLAKPGDVEVHLRARAENPAEAERLCDELGGHILALLGDRVYSTNGDPLEAVVGARLKACGETVAVAESCTGGLLGARFTDVPGSSDWFRGGRIVYSNDAKSDLIGGPLPDDPVSRATALALAEAIGKSAAWGIAVTGVAGPTTHNPEVPVGTIWIGLSGRGKSEAHHVKFIGERARIRSLAALTALNLLRRRLL